jgi:aldehyde dehydrogenase (NAD+)
VAAPRLAGSNKRVTLELGGKAANIIFADAPIDQAVEGIVNGIYFNQGHVCCAGSRLLVEESVHDLIVRKLRDRVQTLRLGDPLDKNTDVGAINSKMQLERIKQLVLAGRRTAPSATARRAPCRRRATGSRLPSSWGRASRRASRARRSSARSSRS